MTYTLEVWLSDDFGATCMGYNADAPYRLADTTTIEGADDREALNVAWRIYNSYPGEMWTNRSYAEVVTSYRERKNRSLSVGDVLSVDGRRYAVASVGFDRLEDR